VPNRDIGAQLAGWLGDEVALYAVGIFNGVVDNGVGDGDNNNEKDVAARLFFHPFRPLGVESLRHFGVGVGGSYGQQQGTPAQPDLPTYRTISQLTMFTFLSDATATIAATAAGTVVADGPHTRISPQGYFYLGPFGLMSELVVSDQRVRKGSVSADLDFWGWQAAGSFVVGGRPSYDGVFVDHPLAPKSGDWGAFEIAARYGAQTNDEAAFRLGLADPVKSAQSIWQTTLGLNWYANRGFKLNVDLEYAQLSHSGQAGHTTETSVLVRQQIAF
jgi:phosphate-selective porin OprO/OprP